jgi:predicted porin
LGFVKPFLNFTTKNNKNSANTASTGASSSSNNSNKQELFTLGLTAPVGSGLLFAEMATGKTKGFKDSSTSTVNGVTTNTNALNGLSQSNKSKAFTLGYRHALSKRTFLQAAYGQSKNTVDSTFTDPAAGTNVKDVTKINTVTKNSGLALTLSHAF